MTDNTQINTGSGDIIRDIDRTAQGITAKTQIVQLDAGGENAESLVTPQNPLPVNELNAAAAQSSDAPEFSAITGNPGGDFAGVDLLEQIINDNSGLGINAKITNLKVDGQGALIPSDMAGPFIGTGSATGAVLIGSIKTSGYNSYSVFFFGGTATFIIEGSNDGSSWATLPGYGPSNSWTPQSLGFSVSLGAPINLFGPLLFAFIRVRLTAFTSGNPTAILLLRSANLPLVLAQPISGLNVDGGVPTNPITISGKVQTTAPAALTQNNQAVLLASSARQLIIKPYQVAEADWQNNLALTTTTSTALVAAGAAGIRNYCTGFSYQNSSATSTTINLLDGATVVWQGNAPASMGVPAMVTFPTPLRGSAATAFNVQLGTAVSTVFANAQGYQSA